MTQAQTLHLGESGAIVHICYGNVGNLYILYNVLF